MSNSAEFIIRAKDMTSTAFNSARDNLGALSSAASSATTVLTGLSGSMLAMGGSAALAVSNLAAQGRELEQQALKAGVSVEQMQALDYATRQYNITGDQFADMVKDAREKVGDFAETGGGEMKDFFEQVAPLVGITADELARLSGPDVLVAVKDALDAANVPAKEQVFYLESLANDASTLAPLLANNAAELRKLSTEFEGLNATMSQADIDALKEMDQELDNVSRRLQGAFATAVIGARDQIDWFTGELEYAVSYWGGLFDSWSDNPRTQDGLATMLADLAEERRELAEQVALFESAEAKMGQKTGSLTKAEFDIYKEQGGDVSALRGQLAKLDAQYATLQQRLQKMRGIELTPPPQIQAPVSGTAGGGRLTKETPWWERLDKEKEYQADSLKGWQTYYGSMEEYYRAQLSADERGVDWSGVSNQAELGDASGYGDASAFADSLVEETQTLEDELQNRRDLLDEYYELDMLSHEEYTEAKAAIDQQATQQRQQMQALELQRASLLFGGLSDLAGVFAGEQSGIYKTLFATEKAFHIASVMMSSTDAIAKAWSSAPFPYNLPAVGMTVAETGVLNAAVNGVQLAGMAHNGIEYVPNEGTWLLDRGERVYTNDSATRIDQMYERMMAFDSSPLTTTATTPAPRVEQYNINALDSKSFTQSARQNQKVFRKTTQRAVRNQAKTEL